jgi:hypothetical protein
MPQTSPRASIERAPAVLANPRLLPVVQVLAANGIEATLSNIAALAAMANTAHPGEELELMSAFIALGREGAEPTGA